MSDVEYEAIPTCLDCGVEMTAYVPGEAEVPRSFDDQGRLTVPAGWRCENVDCPGKESDLAPAAPGQEAVRLRQGLEGQGPDGESL